jgi:hypothetical protein
MLGAAVFAPLALIAILNFGAAEAERWLTVERAEHEAQLNMLRSGEWPDSPAGRKIAAFAERLGPEDARRVRRYWELQAWLVSEAEQVMMDEAAGDATIRNEQIRAAFAELAGLRQALGRSTSTALKALLPFSRNDAWEVSELKQRLGHRRP